MPDSYDAEADAIGSYDDAVRAIGERVRNGAPVPAFFLGRNHIPGRLSPTSFELPEGLPFDRWSEIGAILRGVERGVMWWIGDWVRYGERSYGETYARALDATDYSYQTLRIAKCVADEFELFRRRNNLSWSHHCEVAALPPAEQDELLDLAASEGWSKKQLRGEVSRRRQVIGADADGCDISNLQALVSAGRKFGTIYADPPWPYENQATRSNTGGIYKSKSLTIDELCALPIRDLAADDAHLHLWTTSGFRFEPARIIEAWGFEYRSEFVWVKTSLGIGNYWRLSHETMLTAIRGNAKRFNDKSMRSWLECDRGRHSGKPEQVRAMIEKVSPGPYLELFGRTPSSSLHTPGLWTVWGDEIDRTLFSVAAG